MQNDKPGKEILENAYKLDTPESNETYYDLVAQSYNDTFAAGLGYSLPNLVAQKYSQIANEKDVPIADIGCGTGAIGLQLARPSLNIVGMDISEAMLGEAKKTGVYSELVKVDLTIPLNDVHKNRFGAVLSSGTFTHGHLGPDALTRLLGLALPAALFVITINKKHFVEKGFETVIDQLLKNKTITDYHADEVLIYTEKQHEHSNDKGLLACFRTAA